MSPPYTEIHDKSPNVHIKVRCFAGNWNCQVIHSTWVIKVPSVNKGLIKETNFLIIILLHSGGPLWLGDPEQLSLLLPYKSGTAATGMRTFPPTRVRGGFVGKCQQPLSQRLIRLFSLGGQLIQENSEIKPVDRQDINSETVTSIKRAGFDEGASLASWVDR